MKFIGETGADGGGLTREFFTIFGKDMMRKYFDVTGTFRHNSIALQVCIYNCACVCVYAKGQRSLSQ